MTVRELPANEWHRLHGTLSAQSLRALDPRRTTMLVVEDEGHIVGNVAIFLHPHMEGLWIAPAYRGRVAVGRHLLRAVRERLVGHEVAMMATNADSRRLCERLGRFVHLDCDHYAVTIGAR